MSDNRISLECCSVYVAFESGLNTVRQVLWLKLLKHSWKRSSPCVYSYCSDEILPRCWSSVLHWLFFFTQLLVCKCLFLANSIGLLIVPFYCWTLWTTSIGFYTLWPEIKLDMKRNKFVYTFQCCYCVFIIIVNHLYQ